MSAALKCDRCGAFYEPFGSRLKVIMGNNIPRDFVDLCPVCDDNIQRYLSEYKETKDGKTEEEQPE